MASTAITTQGATLQVDVSVAGTPDTAIENFHSFSGFDGEASELIITNLSSVAVEKLAGLIDNGNFNISWHPKYGAAGQDDVRAAAVSGATKTFLLTLSDGATVKFSGVIKNADSISGGVNAPVDGTVSVAISGALTVTDPA